MHKYIYIYTTTHIHIYKTIYICMYTYIYVAVLQVLDAISQKSNTNPDMGESSLGNTNNNSPKTKKIPKTKNTNKKTKTNKSYLFV